MEKNNDVNEKSKNKKYTIIILLFGLVIIGLVGYIIYDKFYNNVPKTENTTQDSSKIESNKQSENTNVSFVIVDIDTDEPTNYKTTVYLASNDYFKNGTKKELFTKNIISKSVSNNKIFYIDNTNILYVYSVENGQTETYDLMDIAVNNNTAILPGENNVVIMSTNGKALLINLKDKTKKNIDSNNRRGTGVYDEKNNSLYYSTGEDIYKYDITNGQSSLVKEVKGYPAYQDNKYIYFENEINGSEQTYSLNKETAEIKNMNITDYNTSVSSVTTYAKIDNKLFLLINNEDKLIEYKEDKESYVLEADYIQFANIGKQLYIATAPMENDSHISNPGEFNKFYTYDINNSKLEVSDNQFVKELFSYSGIYTLN